MEKMECNHAAPGKIQIKPAKKFNTKIHNMHSAVHSY